MNEREESWLRITYQNANGELHPFLSRLQTDTLGRSLHEEWQEWLASCTCGWEPRFQNMTGEYFPTARYHQSISSNCQLHQTVEAFGRFCAIAEQEWLKVADWYTFIQS
jgi:hypothetical protein